MSAFGQNLNKIIMDFIKKIFPGRNSPSEIEPGQLSEKARHFLTLLLGNSNDAVALVSADGKPLYISPAVERILGYSAKESMTTEIASLIHPDDISIVEEVMKLAFSQPDVAHKAPGLRLKHKSGSWRYIETYVTNRLSDPLASGFVYNFSDVTEITLYREKLNYANRLYSFISQINQAIVQVKDEHSLYVEVCRIAVEQGGFAFAWIGLAEPGTKKIDMVSSCGDTEPDRQYFKDYTYNPKGPIAAVMGGEDFCVVSEEQLLYNKEFARYAKERGFMSTITLALRKSDTTIGAINLYSKEKHFFTPGEVALLLEAVTDISFALEVFEKEKQRAEAELKLRHSQSRLVQAQSIAMIGSWEVNLLTGESNWSDETLRIYGIPQGNNLRTFENWISFIHPEDAGRVLKIIALAEPECADMAFHHRIIRTDGEVRYIYSKSQYEFDKNEKPIGLYGISHDVTEFRIAEEALMRSEMNLRLIVESIPQAVYAKDSSGKLIFVNSNFARVFGYTPTEMTTPGFKTQNQSLARLMKMSAKERAVIRTGQPTEIAELKLTDQDGNERTYHTAILPFVAAGIKEKTVLGIALDITEQQRAEEERTKMIEDIVQRNKDLEQFSYIVSHNLRAPAANIIGLTEELSDGDHDEETNRLLVRELSSSAMRLDDIITDLNTILRIRAKGENSECVKLEEILEHIKVSISHLIGQENALIEADFSKSPDIYAIRSYVYSIFYNLITNSIKFRKPDESPVIKISAIREGQHVHITFTDNGTGIDLQKKGEQVFGLYKRFHQHIEGKGMGLFMVKTQIETMNGSISVHSAPMQGTTFRLILDYCPGKQPKRKIK